MCWDLWVPEIDGLSRDELIALVGRLFGEVQALTRVNAELVTANAELVTANAELVAALTGTRPSDGFVHTWYLLGDRSLHTFEAFVLPDLTGVIVHDRYQNYDAKVSATWSTNPASNT